MFSRSRLPTDPPKSCHCRRAALDVRGHTWGTVIASVSQGRRIDLEAVAYRVATHRTQLRDNSIQHALGLSHDQR
jgi:hypothetical protein